MGCFSWNTADSGEEIMNIYTGEHETVYLLSPDGTTYKEDAYAGYGIFGAKDAYIHLCELNGIERKEGQSDDDFRSAGIDLEMGTFYLNINTGELMSFKHKEKYFDWVKELDSGWTNVQDLLDGMTMQQAVQNKVVIEIPMRPYLLKGRKYNPLKFSFYPDAEYTKLPASTKA